jgi:hypothetical protein
MLFIPFMMYRKFSKLDFNSLTLLRWGLLIGLKDNKIYPEFWQSYVSCFDSKLKNTEKRVVVFDGNNRLGFSNRCNFVNWRCRNCGNTISVKDSLELFMIQTVLKRNGAYSWYSKAR